MLGGCRLAVRQLEQQPEPGAGVGAREAVFEPCMHGRSIRGRNMGLLIRSNVLNN